MPPPTPPPPPSQRPYYPPAPHLPPPTGGSKPLYPSFSDPRNHPPYPHPQMMYHPHPHAPLPYPYPFPPTQQWGGYSGGQWPGVAPSILGGQNGPAGGSAGGRGQRNPYLQEVVGLDPALAERRESGSGQGGGRRESAAGQGQGRREEPIHSSQGQKPQPPTQPGQPHLPPVKVHDFAPPAASSSSSHPMEVDSKPTLPLQPHPHNHPHPHPPQTQTQQTHKRRPSESQVQQILVYGSRPGSPMGEESPGAGGREDGGGGGVGGSAVGIGGSGSGVGGFGNGFGSASGAQGQGNGQQQQQGEVKEDHRKRKRNRTIQSCLPCHQNKRKTGSCVYEVDHPPNPNDPARSETEHMRSRIAELEAVVRELRQKSRSKTLALGPNAGSFSTFPSRPDHTQDPEWASHAITPGAPGPSSKKRKLIVDRFARFKIDQAEDVLATGREFYDLSEMEQGRRMIETTFGGGGGGGGGQGGGSGNSSRRTSISDGHGGAGKQVSGVAHTAESSGSGGGGGVAQTWRERDAREKENNVSRRSSASAGGGNYGEEPYVPTMANPDEEIVGDAQGRQAYVGVPGGREMLRRLKELTASKSSRSESKSTKYLTVPEDAAFHGVFPDLRKTFPFTTIWSHENFSGEIVGLLPTMEQAELLWSSFTEEIAMFFCAWHLPTLKQEYHDFFKLSPQEKMSIPLGSLSVYLMISALGIMMRASQKEIFGVEPAANKGMRTDEVDLTCSRLQSELYLSGAYQALRLCSFLSSPTISTVTSQILIGIYLLNSERASDFWPSLGSLVRQAVAIGMHIDPLRLYPEMTVRGVEVRRRIWWTIAGLDALLCVSLGRPSCINYYNTQLPQDLPDDNLPETPSDADQVHTNHILSTEITSQTYHTAYFELTIPSFELLDRVFHHKRQYSRSGTAGWFAPPADAFQQAGHDHQSTYDDALRLDGDIVSWYNLIPAGMRFNADEDTAESLLRERSRARINQTLALCVKSTMIRLILHRPYLRADPEMYPLSSQICFQAAHTLLAAYKAMHGTQSSIAWSWWTMSLRAFHAGAVCAFLAVRQPNNPIAEQCLEDIRGAILIFEGRQSNWPKAHPVQGHLCEGLMALEKLAATATKQAQHDESMNGTDEDRSPEPSAASTSGGTNRFANLSAIPAFPTLGNRPQMPGSPMMGNAMGSFDSPAAPAQPVAGASTARPASSHLTEPSPFQYFFPVQQREAVNIDSGLAGAPDSMALPQFWAEVFGININQDPNGANPLLQLS